jgi:hypothetical protein
MRNQHDKHSNHADGMTITDLTISDIWRSRTIASRR